MTADLAAFLLRRLSDDAETINRTAEYADHSGAERMLDEASVKAKLVKRHSIVHREVGWLEDGQEEHKEIPVCGHCVPKHSHYQRREDIPEGPCLTARRLALPYAGHPDYREEWRP